LLDWAEEKGEDLILDKHGITPGELRARLDIADWLLYSASELARILKLGIASDLRKLRLRLQYGVKPELLNLVRLKGIGRVRARALYNAGFKSVSDLKRASEEALASIVGLGIARKIKEQLAV